MSNNEAIEDELATLFGENNDWDDLPSCRRSGRPSKVPHWHQTYATGSSYPSTSTDDEQPVTAYQSTPSRIVNDVATLKSAMDALQTARSNSGISIDSCEPVVRDDPLDITAKKTKGIVVVNDVTLSVGGGIGCQSYAAGRKICAAFGRGRGRGRSCAPAKQAADPAGNLFVDSKISPVGGSRYVYADIVVKNPAVENGNNEEDHSIFENDVTSETEFEKPSTPGAELTGSSLEPPVRVESLVARNKRSYSSGRSSADSNSLVSEGELHEPPMKRRNQEGKVRDSEEDLLGMSVIEALAKIYKQFQEYRRESNQRYNVLLQRFDALQAQVTVERSSAFPRKPDCLPLRAAQDLAAFENIEGAEFDRVVDFLGSLSCGSIAERANLIVKDAIDDDLAPRLTVLGHEPNTTKVEGTRFSDALYAALSSGIARNDRPSRRAFVAALTNAMKAAKQRYRRLHPKAAEIQHNVV